MNIDWEMSGKEIEEKSFRIIEEEMGEHPFEIRQWRVVRRMIHTCTDLSIAGDILFANAPIEAGLAAMRDGAPIYSDSNMIRSGLSLAKLQSLNSAYSRESIHCYVSDPDVAKTAREKGITRSLAALGKAKGVLGEGIVLIGNAPLALAGIARMIKEENIRPRLVIGMPVGFVHVVESKEMIMAEDVPQIVLRGRRGGSPLAVAALHGIIESAQEL